MTSTLHDVSPEVDRKVAPYFAMHLMFGVGIVAVAVVDGVLLAVVLTEVVGVIVSVLVGEDVKDVVSVVTWQLWNPPASHDSTIALRVPAVLIHSVLSKGIDPNAHAISSTGSFACSGPRNSCITVFNEDTSSLQCT